MTLQRFLHQTATVPEPALRRAITLGLGVERPTSREGYARFYRRVSATLCASPCEDRDQVSRQSVLAAA